MRANASESPPNLSFRASPFIANLSFALELREPIERGAAVDGACESRSRSSQAEAMQHVNMKGGAPICTSMIMGAWPFSTLAYTFSTKSRFVVIEVKAYCQRKRYNARQREGAGKRAVLGTTPRRLP